MVKRRLTAQEEDDLEALRNSFYYGHLDDDKAEAFLVKVKQFSPDEARKIIGRKRVRKMVERGEDTIEILEALMDQLWGHNDEEGL